jgi:hypothetical protein
MEIPGGLRSAPIRIEPRNVIDITLAGDELTYYLASTTCFSAGSGGVEGTIGLSFS